VKAFMVAGLLVLAHGWAMGAIEVRLEASSANVAVGEPVYLQVHVNDPAGVDCIIEFPPSPAFTSKAAGVSQNHSVRIINSKVERTSSWIRNWVFVPQQAGRFILGPATCRIGSRVLTTGTVTLEVSATQARPTPRRPQRRSLFDFFDQDPFGQHDEEETEIAVETVFDQTVVWAGQQVVQYVDILATRPSVLNVEFSQIQRHGFWEVKPDQRQRPQPEKITRDERDWYRYRYVVGYLFPLTSGLKTVDPFAVRVEYDRFWPRSRVVQTGRLALQVRDLPADPAGRFSGAVGVFTLEGSVEPGDEGYLQDKPFTLSLTLKGEGNVRAAGEPVFSRSTNLRIMQPKIETDTRTVSGRMHGIRRWKYQVYPLVGGIVSVPQAVIRVFDPGKGGWADLSYAAQSVRITPSLEGTNRLPASGTGEPRCICVFPPRGELPSAISFGAAVLILAPAVLWCFLAIWLAHVRAKRDADLPGYARRNAGKVALVSLAAAAGQPDIPSAVETTLRNYAIQKTSAPPGGTTESLRVLLQREGIDEALLVRWQRLLEQAALLRYGGQADDPRVLLDEARRCIAAMEGRG